MGERERETPTTREKTVRAKERERERERRGEGGLRMVPPATMTRQVRVWCHSCQQHKTALAVHLHAGRGSRRAARKCSREFGRLCVPQRGIGEGAEPAGGEPRGSHCPRIAGGDCVASENKKQGGAGLLHVRKLLDLPGRLRGRLHGDQDAVRAHFPRGVSPPVVQGPELLSNLPPQASASDF